MVKDGLEKLILTLIVLLLGFTCTGVVGGSIAACCRSPETLQGGWFATMQMVGATALLLPFTPVTAILGAVGGFIYYLIALNI